MSAGKKQKTLLDEACVNMVHNFFDYYEKNTARVGNKYVIGMHQDRELPDKESGGMKKLRINCNIQFDIEEI